MRQKVVPALHKDLWRDWSDHTETRVGVFLFILSSSAGRSEGREAISQRQNASRRHGNANVKVAHEFESACSPGDLTQREDTLPLFHAVQPTLISFWSHGAEKHPTVESSAGHSRIIPSLRCVYRTFLARRIALTIAYRW